MGTNEKIERIYKKKMKNNCINQIHVVVAVAGFTKQS